MKIIKNRSIVKFYIYSIMTVFILITTFSFFLGFDVNIKNTLFYLMILMCEITIIMLLKSILFRRKLIYLIDKEKLELVSKEKTVLILDLSNIDSAKYYRQFWAFLLQFGAGYLFIYYRNKDNKEEHIEIAMSKKDALLLKEKYLKNLIIY